MSPHQAILQVGVAMTYSALKQCFSFLYCLIPFFLKTHTLTSQIFIGHPLIHSTLWHPGDSGLCSFGNYELVIT